jgi:hypothetical protein
VRRSFLVLSVVLTTAALAEPVTLRLPPSDGWKELEHEGEQRIFVLAKDESMRLEVDYVEKQPRYTQELLMDTARRLAKEMKGKEFHVTEATTLNLRGATAGVMKATSNDGRSVRWWLPGDEWDLQVVLKQTGAKWSSSAENEVSNAVSLATNLRGSGGTSDAQLLLYVGIAAVVLIGGGLGLAVLRRPKQGAAAPAPAPKKVPDSFKPTKKA